MGTHVVTGSASGIGAAICRRLARDGQRVIGVDRRDADVVGDLGEEAERRRVLAEVREQSGGALDGVVSCAGIGPECEPVPILKIDFFAALAVLDELRDLLARGTKPAAVAISSLAGTIEPVAIPEVLEACRDGDEKRALERIAASDGMTAYVNAKRALAQAVRRRAPEWGSLGIRLNAVAPGRIETPMLERLMADEIQAAPLRALSIPLGRSAPPEEIASCVAFLLGPEAAYVHGHLLIADGGAHALMYPDHI